MKKIGGLTVHQWLLVDAAGSVLAGAGVCWRTMVLLGEDDSFVGALLLIVDLIPVCTVLLLAALLLWGSWENGALMRLPAGLGAAAQLAAGGLHAPWAFTMEDIPLILLTLVLFAAGAAGLLSALFGAVRRTKP